MLVLNSYRNLGASLLLNISLQPPTVLLSNILYQSFDVSFCLQRIKLIYEVTVESHYRVRAFWVPPSPAPVPYNVVMADWCLSMVFHRSPVTQAPHTSPQAVFFQHTDILSFFYLLIGNTNLGCCNWKTLHPVLPTTDTKKPFFATALEHFFLFKPHSHPLWYLFFFFPGLSTVLFTILLAIPDALY